MKILKNIRPIIERELQTIISKRGKKTMKPDNSYVSEGDLHMDKLVADFVKENYTSVQLVSEESSKIHDIDLSLSEYVITVDPIDGTENFVSGLKEWGIGISVYRNGEHPRSAAVRSPQLGRVSARANDPTPHDPPHPRNGFRTEERRGTLRQTHRARAR